MPTDSDRLNFLIENEAYVAENSGMFRVWQSAWGDADELTPHNKATGGCGWNSAREAIDAAMEKGNGALPSGRLGDRFGTNAMTLHEAIAEVLRTSGCAMTARDIAAEVNRRGLYSRKDRLPVPSNQIIARANNYSHIFTRHDGMIDLRTKP